MNRELAIWKPVSFGLAFDVEKANTKSGFKPAQFDFGAGKELFGDIRLDGFAALLRIGFSDHLTIFGGNEGRYKNDLPVINRAWAIREMLIHDCGINEKCVSFIPTNSNTGGNVAAMSATMKEGDLEEMQCAVVSNHYHLPRASMDIVAANLEMPTYAAEAYWLLEQDGRKNLLIERLGGGPLAERVAEEIQGVADKIRGTYKPRTDVSVESFKSTQKQHS